MIFSDGADTHEELARAHQIASAAISFVADELQNQTFAELPATEQHAVTVNFHPDAMCNGRSTLECLADEGRYHSQFETRISNGSLSSHPGGRRWTWEQQMFGGVYDQVPARFRPKYGALNHACHPLGGAPRFGSAHLRLNDEAAQRCTYCYPDSHLGPENFATTAQGALIALVVSNPWSLDCLDNYVEAHIHGFIDIDQDVDALVLDPSYRSTSIERTALQLPCKLEWHDGVQLHDTMYESCKRYRGQQVADFIRDISCSGHLTARQLGWQRSVDTCDAQLIKKAWHCMARFGA